MSARVVSLADYRKRKGLPPVAPMKDDVDQPSRVRRAVVLAGLGIVGALSVLFAPPAPVKKPAAKPKRRKKAS